ncbi:MAG TPA: lamin tail domain-containing protein, partial [Lacipirellulaceae bacterium]|nr:lamin tail domain-containing protein [Lacipirellulaceae bacterium]
MGRQPGRFLKTRRLRLELLEPRLVLDASMLKISEFGASNHDVINDYDGDASDWIELYNSGSTPVSLTGMHLTDDATKLSKWTFPTSTNLAAGGYLVVFASDKNKVEPNGELHTNFKLSADGEYLGLVDTDGATILDQYTPSFPAQLDDISYGRAMQLTGAMSTLVAPGAADKAIVPTNDSAGLAWTQATYNDSAWPLSGTTGLGYENSPSDPINYANLIHTAVPSGTTSAYMRINFTLSSLVGIDKLTLRMKYDDGFVAYINGVEVAEANNPEVTAWNAIATTNHDDAASIQYVDFDVSSIISQLHVGQNVLAIQALNTSGSSDMLVLPELDAQAATLVTPDKFGYFETPTPGYGNSDNVLGFATNPDFSVQHGYYSTPQLVAITTTTPGAFIVYTTNGSTPQVDANLQITNGTLYTLPLTIGSTTTLRAVAFDTGFKQSFISASSYIFVADVVNQSPLGQTPAGWPNDGVNGQNINYGIDPDIINLYGSAAVQQSLASLPAISITTDLSNLFDPTTGIYVNALNRGDSWERASTIELINPDGSDGFEVNAGLRIRGGYSRNDFDPKHGFRLYFRSEYGDAKLDYPLFGDEGTDEFNVLDLRTDQNYSWASAGDVQNSLVAEVFGRDTQRDMGQPYTRSQYYQLYI